jgi:hypothetical protein
VSVANSLPISSEEMPLLPKGRGRPSARTKAHNKLQHRYAPPDLPSPRGGTWGYTARGGVARLLRIKIRVDEDELVR